ncbi:unnamed protein product, partial [Allacma fusca]
MECLALVPWLMFAVFTLQAYVNSYPTGGVTSMENDDPEIVLQEPILIEKNKTLNSPITSSPLVNLFLWTIQQLKSHHKKE